MGGFSILHKSAKCTRWPNVKTARWYLSDSIWGIIVFLHLQSVNVVWSHKFPSQNVQINAVSPTLRRYRQSIRWDSIIFTLNYCETTIVCILNKRFTLHVLWVERIFSSVKLLLSASSSVILKVSRRFLTGADWFYIQSPRINSTAEVKTKYPKSWHEWTPQWMK